MMARSRHASDLSKSISDNDLGLNTPKSIPDNDLGVHRIHSTMP
jgi:hypothetical protein